MGDYVSFREVAKSEPLQAEILIEENEDNGEGGHGEVGMDRGERHVTFAIDPNQSEAPRKKLNPKRRNSKQFWMDDAACKACFICETPFSLFKRKHHCRCCGKIFCSNCASKTVDGTEYGYDGHVRVCDECYEFAGKVKDGVDQKKTHSRRIKQHKFPEEEESADSEDVDHVKSHRAAASASKPFGVGTENHFYSTTRDSLLSSSVLNSGGLVDSPRSNGPSSLLLQAGRTAEQGVMMDRNRNNNGSSSSGTMVKHTGLNEVQQGLKQRERRGEMSRLDLVELMNDQDDIDGQLLSAISGKERRISIGKKQAMNKTMFSHRRTRSNSFEEKRKREGGIYGERSKSFKRKGSANRIDIAETVAALRKEYELMTGLKVGDAESTIRMQKDMFDKRLDKAVTILVEKEIHELRNKRPSILLSEDVQKQWCRELIRITKQFCSSVRPYHMNFDSYCKLVSIPGGSIQESSLLNGIICDHNVVHRLMRQRITRPRIMLLSSAIEFLREKSRISSLDVLREQEQQYMELVVRKITSVEVDLLLVGNAVSRIAQQLLLEANVSLVINVPKTLLERISWLTGALILPTTDHITQRSDPCGSCALWCLREFSTELSDAQRSEQLEQTKARNDRGKRTKTFMFFEGCPPRLGASIYLRGGSPTTLRHVEAILSKMITTTYTLKQQNSLFFDIGIVLPDHMSSQGGEDGTEENQLMTCPTFRFAEITIQGRNQMHPTEIRNLVFGTTGSDLTLGEFLRKRCFTKETNNNSSSGSGSGSGSGGGSSSTSANNVTQSKPIGRNMATSINGDIANKVEQEGTTTTAGTNSPTLLPPPPTPSSPPQQQQEQQQTNFPQQQLGHHQQQPKESISSNNVTTSNSTSLASISAGLLQVTSIRGADESSSQDELDMHRPISVYQVSTGRVYVFKRTLSKLDPVQGPLREMLMNIRREYVAKSIRRLQETGPNQSWGMPIKNHSILTWSECCRCDAVTNFRILSKDAESLSFGRWLELKFFYKARNIASLFPDSESFCKHQIFQDYTTYFEYMGQVAGFEYEPCIPYKLAIRDGETHSWSEPMLMNRYAQKWREDTVKIKQQELETMVRHLEHLFLKEKLLQYLELYGHEIEGVSELVNNLVQKIKGGIAYHLDILQNKDDLLQLNRVRRELLQSALEWNDDMSQLSSNVSTQITRSPTNKRGKKQGQQQQQLTNLLDAFHLDGDEDKTVEEQLDTNNVGSKVKEQEEKPKVDGEALDVGKKNEDDDNDVEGEENDVDQEEPGLALSAIRKMNERCALLFPVQLPELFVLRGRPTLPIGFGNKAVLVYDEEPTSWIAYALNSKEHRQQLFGQAETFGHLEDFQNNDWGKILKSDSMDPKGSAIELTFHDAQPDDSLDFRFSVKTYFPLQFYALRQAFYQCKNDQDEILEAETNVLVSLSRCHSWNATGGKSKSKFFKTRDGRFIAKSVTSEELDMFMAVSENYFHHLGDIHESDHPSILMKIIGVYTVTPREGMGTGGSSALQPQTSFVESLSELDATHNSPGNADDDVLPPIPPKLLLQEQRASSADSPKTTGSGSSSIPMMASSGGSVTKPISSIQQQQQQHESSSSSSSSAGTKTHYIILESLYQNDEEYNLKFDLKGNFRNRFVENQRPGDTLMDKNFQIYTNGIPLPLTDESKKLLVRAVENDTKFLESAGIVDYSILLGIPSIKDEKELKMLIQSRRNPVLKVGLIDYLQLYNIKKMIESNVKRAGMIAGQLEPTVVDPTAYRARLIKCLDRYFTAIPSNSADVMNSSNSTATTASNTNRANSNKTGDD